MSHKAGARAPGQIRRSQVITTFGPGAMVDLPNHSVLIGGLDFWTRDGEEVFESRLIAKLTEALQVPTLRLFTPPADQTDPTLPQSGIDAFQFPEWFVTQDVESKHEDAPVRSRMLVHRKLLTRGKFIDHNKKRRNVVPVRFVRACRAGHIGDINWYGFVHGPASECRRQLWIDERGTSGDLTEVWIRCDCGVPAKQMALAAIESSQSLGLCDGARPWLGPFSPETCGAPNRLLVRTASNAYFPQKITVISLPERDETVKQAVDAVWDNLEAVETIDDLKYERKKAKVKPALEGLTDEEVFAEIQSRRDDTPKVEKKVKVAELETLVASKDELGDDKPDGTFFARALPRTAWDRPWMKPFEKIVLVHRLREVVAQLGFTRFESISTDAQGELDINVRRASLAREVTWLPAIENKGEGIFIQFRSDAITEWLDRREVIERGRRLADGFASWKKEHDKSKRVPPGLPYGMLHSFSHLLITAISLECGYPASSIRERIYAVPDIGYGILLYTGSSDAEGTLGGIVQVGRRIHEHVRNALEIGQLCSNDPVCAQHEPQNEHERRFLQGAACHGCLLIAETSCEQQNDFLDRALVVPTIDNCGAEFFRKAAT